MVLSSDFFDHGTKPVALLDCPVKTKKSLVFSGESEASA
jgi:hypothetical protein